MRAARASMFSTLWRRYAPAVQCVLMTIVADRDTAALTQEVEDLAASAFPPPQGLDLFPPWVCALARKVGRRALECGAVRREGSEGRRPENVAGPSLEADEILRQIRRLPGRYREPLMLRLVLRMSGPEIVQFTGSQETAVRDDLCRGMRLLRRCLRTVEPPAPGSRTQRFWTRFPTERQDRCG